ncbi:hypothetical protein OR606_02225 [Aeromonas hydrophila]|uniref:hypothetical protein n=1 Tax=Aeromonas hydrophila TaxID=644 RepID=UPI001112D52A|nr:hypothetical protein [Aeromonas hydrophila]MCX4039017.1 hypothetical protein [Aeromonas hydrophila]HAU4873698.1 hypothetical protein [Aeromonas hydrophila]HAU4918852.1 hypothetical protein [Aeromonas hydrophila]
MEYIGEIISFIVGLGSGFALHIASSKTNQNNNIVGGDLVGKDKISTSQNAEKSQAIIDAIRDCIDKKSEEMVKQRIDSILKNKE